MNKKKLKNTVYKDRTKKQILNSIERGAKQAAGFLRGEIELENSKDLLTKWYQ